MRGTVFRSQDADCGREKWAIVGLMSHVAEMELLALRQEARNYLLVILRFSETFLQSQHHSWISLFPQVRVTSLRVMTRSAL